MRAVCDLQREARGTGHNRSEFPWRIDPSDVCESESQGSEVAHQAGKSGTALG